MIDCNPSAVPESVQQLPAWTGVQARRTVLDQSGSGVHVYPSRKGWTALAWHPGGNGSYTGPCPLEAVALACECAVSERGRAEAVRV